MPLRKIETRVPFSEELSSGEVTLTVESTDDGTDVWIRQGGDALLMDAADWPTIRKAVDDVIAAHETLTASQFQRPETPDKD